jgi:hypothetical protein
MEDKSEDQIIEEILDICMNYGEPERRKALKDRYIIVRREKADAVQNTVNPTTPPPPPTPK